VIRLDFRALPGIIHQMKRLAILVLLVLPVSARGQRIDEPVAIHARPGSTLTIRGSTTIGARWHCGAANVRATAVMSDTAVSPDAHEVRWVTVVVPVSDLKCQSGPMDRAMRKAMRADGDSVRVIEGHFTTDPGQPDSSRARHLLGTLTVSGVTQQVAFGSAVDRLPDGMLRVRSTIPLTLSGFQVTPPRVLFGAVRARDQITVEVDLTFPAPATPQP
jgi:hypothetical protein